jgi:DnaK suppressor protein
MSTDLTPAQRASLRADLEQALRRLDRRLADELGEGSRAEHAHEVLQQDGDDAPQRDADREVDLALTDRQTQQLGAIAEALRRLDTGHYGRCADCDAPIPLARLRAEPWALRCVDCEARREAQA